MTQVHDTTVELDQSQLAMGTARRLNQRGASKLYAVIAVVVILLVIACGVVAASIGSNQKTADNVNERINTKEYQALFLTNGQVYFGKLSNLNSKYVTLSDIYYLQVQQSTDQGQSLQQAGNTTDASSKVSLAKLGQELHGPEDKMQVASDQVLFWENLKNDSKVVQAIAKYKNQ